MNAVVKIVSSDGLAAATVRRIAQELDCSPGQIHHHFASADALRAEAVREVWRRLEPALIAVLQKFAPRERLVIVLSGCATAFSNELDPLMHVAERLWKEAWNIRGDPAVREAISEGIGKMYEEIAASLVDGMESGVFPQGLDVGRIAMGLIAASQGFDMLEGIGARDKLGADKPAFIDSILRKEGL